MSEIGGINLLNIINKKSIKQNKMFIESHLVERNSVKKL